MSLHQRPIRGNPRRDGALQGDVFYGVPTLYEYLKEHKDTDKADWRAAEGHSLGRRHAARIDHDRLGENAPARASPRATAFPSGCATSHVNPIDPP